MASAGTPHNWLDNALGADDVTPVMVENAKSLWRVLPIFAVLPVFWMLFNQQVRSRAGMCAIWTKRRGGRALAHTISVATSIAILWHQVDLVLQLLTLPALQGLQTLGVCSQLQYAIFTNFRLLCHRLLL